MTQIILYNTEIELTHLHKNQGNENYNVDTDRNGIYPSRLLLTPASAFYPSS